MRVLNTQVVKSRLQGAPEGTYKGFMDCARQTVAKDGVGALFKGFGPAMARVRFSRSRARVPTSDRWGHLARCIRMCMWQLSQCARS